jgi:hypothetical protein
MVALILIVLRCNIPAMDGADHDFHWVLSSAMNVDKQQVQQIIRTGLSIDVVDNRDRSAVLLVIMQNNIDALQLLN